MRDWISELQPKVVDTCTECGCDITTGHFRFKYKMKYTYIVLCEDCHDAFVDEEVEEEE